MFNFYILSVTDNVTDNLGINSVNKNWNRIIILLKMSTSLFLIKKGKKKMKRAELKPITCLRILLCTNYKLDK